MTNTSYRRLKAKAKTLPVVPAAYGFMNGLLERVRPRRRQDVFSTIYRDNSWNDPESRSGAGSNLQQTAAVRRELPRLLRELSAASLLDAPCGDFWWLSEVDLGGVQYTGVDIVPALIEQNAAAYGAGNRTFLVADVVNTPLPAADVILCRDCLVHLSFADVRAAIANFVASGSTYLLTTTFTEHKRNYDKQTGRWRPLNLCAAPFNFPAPLRLMNEECPEEDGSFSDKCLGLWKLEDLRVPTR
jgi:SAM-dependent methyltransferase